MGAVGALGRQLKADGIEIVTLESTQMHGRSSSRVIRFSPRKRPGSFAFLLKRPPGPTRTRWPARFPSCRPRRSGPARALVIDPSDSAAEQAAAWRAALASTDIMEQQRRALYQLAALGELQPDDLAAGQASRAIGEAQAQILSARSDAARGRTEQAVMSLRQHAESNSAAAEMLIEVLAGAESYRSRHFTTRASVSVCVSSFVVSEIRPASVSPASSAYVPKATTPWWGRHGAERNVVAPQWRALAPWRG